jgi:hypothetical protein
MNRVSSLPSFAVNIVLIRHPSFEQLSQPFSNSQPSTKRLADNRSPNAHSNDKLLFSHPPQNRLLQSYKKINHTNVLIFEHPFILICRKDLVHILKKKGLHLHCIAAGILFWEKYPLHFSLLRHKPLRFLFHSRKYFSQKPCFSKMRFQGRVATI